MIPINGNTIGELPARPLAFIPARLPRPHRWLHAFKAKPKPEALPDLTASPAKVDLAEKQ